MNSGQRKTMTMTTRTMTRPAQRSRSRSLGKADLERFKDLLQNQREEMSEDLRDLNESLRSLQERQQGAGSWNLDFARDSADTESSEHLAYQIRRLSDTLTQVVGALGRIDQGTFGICVRCGNAIDKERLEAIPFTRRCIECSRSRAT